MANLRRAEIASPRQPVGDGSQEGDPVERLGDVIVHPGSFAGGAVAGSRASLATASPWSAASGTVNQKRLPRPSLLSTPISPPSRSIRLFEMASPRPVPP